MSVRHFIPLPLSCAAIVAVASPSIARSAFKSPAWLSIEAPVNPYDPATRGQALLVHTQLVQGEARLSDLTGTAEGLVNGGRRSIPLRFDTMSRPNTFGVRRQWPADGAWMLKISLHETTALVSLDAAGNVSSARVPMVNTRDIPLPRAVTTREIDSALTQAAKR